MSAIEADIDAAEMPVMHDGVEVTDARQAIVGDIAVRRLPGSDRGLAGPAGSARSADTPAGRSRRRRWTSHD
jgi:hypothetical protein